MGTEKVVLGKSGEDYAAEFLEREGYKIVERNFRCKLGEIDIIALKEGVLVFCEVKTRRSLKYGYPSEAVTPMKLRHISRCATLYWHGGFRYRDGIAGEAKTMQIDVIEVLMIEGKAMVRHIKGVDKI